jgi:integrase
MADLLLATAVATSSKMLGRSTRTRAGGVLVLPGYSPTAGCLAPARSKMLTPAEEQALFAAMTEPGRSIARLAALTLMRLSEIRFLKPEQVDLTHGLVLLPRTKTIPRQVVLSKGTCRTRLKHAAERDSG